MSREQIIDYFRIFGNVEDLELPIDRLKKKRREFCFVIFDTEEAADAASKKAKQSIHGRECDVKKGISFLPMNLLFFLSNFFIFTYKSNSTTNCTTTKTSKFTTII